MPGASSHDRAARSGGRADALVPPERPHYAGGARRGSPLARAFRRAGQALRRVHRDLRTWRQRGPAGCQDRSARPCKLPWKASEEERAIVRALRRATGFPLDDLTLIVTHFLPHLDRDAVYRILKAEGLNRLPPSAPVRKPHGTFNDDEVGFVHVDVKHPPKRRDRGGVTRKRYLHVAIDRASRHVHLAVEDSEPTASAVAFLDEVLAALPFQVTHVLTDRGSCSTAEGFEHACRRHGVAHRTKRPCTPRTNGMVERFNGRVRREVLGITLHSHRDLETVLAGFDTACNSRRQCVLKGLLPEVVLRQRLEADPALIDPGYKPPEPRSLQRALRIVADAKEVSHPDS